MPIRREAVTANGPGFGNGRRSVLNPDQTTVSSEAQANTKRASMALKLSPRWTVAAIAALAGGVLGVLTPVAWIERLAFELYLDQLTPAAAAPLGTTARLLFALALAVLFGLVGWAATRFVLRPKVREGVPAVGQRGLDRAREAVSAPALRRADAHPDAPSRAPLRADLDLPPEGLDPAKPAFDASRIAPPPRPVVEEMPEDAAMTVDADTDMVDELDLAGMECMDADAGATEPMPTVEEVMEPTAIHATDWPAHQGADVPAAPFGAPPPAPAPATVAIEVPVDPSDDSLGAKLARFEAGLVRRATEPPSAANAGPAPRLGELNPDSPSVDMALQSALSTLERLSRRAAI